MKARIFNKKEISKKTNEEYNILVIDLENSKGLSLQILDFGNITPCDMELEVDIEKNEKGFYFIKQLDYSISYKYNLALNVLLMGESC